VDYGGLTGPWGDFLRRAEGLIIYIMLHWDLRARLGALNVMGGMAGVARPTELMRWVPGQQALRGDEKRGLD